MSGMLKRAGWVALLVPGGKGYWEKTCRARSTNVVPEEWPGMVLAKAFGVLAFGVEFVGVK